MFGNYTSFSRRRSSNSNPRSPTSPPLPNQAHSPSFAPASPSAANQPSGDLGSPFSLVSNPLSGAVSANAYGYGFTDGSTVSHRPSLPALNESARDHDSDYRHDRDRELDLLASGGSRAPLVARDFGISGSSNNNGNGQGRSKQYPIGKDGEDDNKQGAASQASRSSDTFRILPGDDSLLSPSSMDASPNPIKLNQPPHSRATDDPSLVPPPSVHDTYVSKHVEPIAPPVPSPDLARPGLNRSSSAPGHPHSGLLPSALPASAAETADDTNQPIFQIFDANLTDQGVQMSKKLRGYLEVVLKGQEEVAKMHLELEGLNMGENGWGVPGHQESDGAERAEKREKGVDEIMRKLDELSENLRNYHQLGTPKLTFPRQPVPQKNPTTPPARDRDPDGAKPWTQSHSLSRDLSAEGETEASPHDLSRAKTIAGPASPEHKIGGQTRPRAPTLVRSNTALGQVSPRSLARDRAKPRSPLVNTFRPPSSDDSYSEDRGAELSPPGESGDHGIHDGLDKAGTANSRSGTGTGTGTHDTGNKYEPSVLFPDSSPEKMKGFWDDPKDGGQGWLEDVLGQPSLPAGRDGLGGKERRITDSPTDMSFRSRW